MSQTSHRAAPRDTTAPGAAAGVPPPSPPSSALPAWPLAALAGLLPLLAALTALGLSIRLDLVPACNPFIDGCVSVSRAARHGLPNHLFRALMLPAATLQALVWVLAARWLGAGLGPRPGVRAMVPLGLVAAVALVLYATFLGVDGHIYRWLRRYGTVVYFGFTCICLLLTGGGVQALVRRGALDLPRWLERAMLTLAGALVALGLGNAIVAALFGEPLKGRIENVTEWWGSLIFVLGFLALAAMWHRQALRITVVDGRPAARPPAPGG